MKGSRVQISVSARNQEVASQDATSFSYVAGGAGGMRPICRLPKDDCRTPMGPIPCGLAGHTRIRTATSRVAGTPATCFASPSRFRRASPQRHCIPVSTSRSSTVRPLSVTKRRIRIGGLKPKCRPGPESGPFCRTNAAGRQPGMENPRNGRPEAYVVWQTTNPLISKNPAPGCGDSGGVGRGPAPRGSVPLRRKAGGSRADRQLSAACVAEYGVRRFKTDAHPALHTICRKRKI